MPKQMMLTRKIMVTSYLVPRLCSCRYLSVSQNLLSTPETNSDFVRTLLGCNDETWNTEETQFLNKYDRICLLDSYKSVKKLGFSNEDIHQELRILAFRSQTITSRYRIYLDYCFDRSTINIGLIHHYIKTMGLSIYQHKRNGHIDKNKQVLIQLNEKLKVDMEMLTESMPLKRVHYDLIARYMALTLGMSIDEAKYNIKKYPNLRCRSFKCIHENVQVLMNKFDFTNEKIRKHVYVLHADKENMLRLLKLYPKLGSVPMKNIVYSYPNIILSPITNIQSVIQCIEKYGYTREQISKAPMILILKPSTVEERLQRIHTEEWFRPYAGLPRALFLVFNLPGVERRRTILNDLNMKCASINVLACPSVMFNAYAKNGRDKLNSRDGYTYISSTLNMSFEDVLEKLDTHPYKRYVSLQQIHNSMTFLEKKFSRDDIYKNLQIVLYPEEMILEAMQKLEDPSVLDTKPCQDDQGVIRHEFILPLVLYLIERENNFSGHGIWKGEEVEIEPQTVKDENGEEREVPVSLLPLKKLSRKPWTRNKRSSS